MTTLKALRDRLRSVKNIKHITEAMEVVASVRFRKFMQKVEKFSFYTSKLEEIIRRLRQSAESEGHPLFDVREPKRIAVAIIAGDKGLSGAYNQNVIRSAERFLAKYRKEDVDLILFGQKVYDHFKKLDWNIKETHIDYIKQASPDEIKKWCGGYVESFIHQEWDELWVIYTHYINVLAREVKQDKILPLKQAETVSKDKKIDYIFEPDPATIYKEIIPFYFNAKFESTLFESYASELSSRIVAMKAAAKNAEDMIESLTLQKNKTRQLNITNEILEITAAAEGIK